MNELLIRHGCCTVFSLPPGLKELMSDISREVLREQPAEIYEFITNYLSALLITREHGVLAVKILDDLCDCRPTMVEHFLEIGFKYKKSTRIAELVQTEIEDFEPTIGNERFVEATILRKVLNQFRNVPEDEQVARLLQVIRNAYKDYWYRKKLMSQQVLNKAPLETWEQAVENTLNIYKKTKPSLLELHRATLKIQAAYRGYYIRKQMTPKPQFVIPPKVDTRPLDIAESRELDLGPLLKMTPKDDAARAMLEAHRQNVKYDPLHAIDFRADRPESESDVLETASDDTPHSWEDGAALDKEIEAIPATEYDTHKKISFAKVTLRDIEAESNVVEEPHEEIPEVIAAEVVDDVIKAIPTGSLEQIPDQPTEAGQENIPEQLTENAPSQETDNIQEDIPETLPEQITESIHNVEEVPEQITENIHGQDNVEEVPEQITETVGGDQVTEGIPQVGEVAEVGDQVNETVHESEAIPEQITEAAPETTAAAENVSERTSTKETYDDPTVEVKAMKKAQGLEDPDPTADSTDHKPMNVQSLAPDMTIL